MSKSNTYIQRRFFTKTDVDILADGIKNQQNIMLLGPRGTGKSSLAEAAAVELKRKFCYIPCHTGASTEALIGQWIPNPSGTGYVWMDGVLTNAVRTGKVCLLDEVNSLKPEIAFAIHGLLDHRRELVLTDKPGVDGSPEVVKAHEEFGLIAAGNPFYEGVRVMNEAFRDRFAIQLNLSYNVMMDTEVLHVNVNFNKLPIKQAVAILKFVGGVRKASKNKAIHSDISTRAFLDLTENWLLHGPQVARTLFLTRFSDDDAEVTALRACFNDVWNEAGDPLNVTAAEEQEMSKSRGRAGRFAAKTDNKLGEGVF